MKNIIKKIAKEFNKREVVWAIGGSYLLKRYGIDSKSNALDIMVSEDTIVKALKIMDEFAVKQIVTDSEHFHSDFYEEYIFEGQAVNIVSNFKSNFKEKFTYDFTSKDISVSVVYKGETINYCYLMDWYLIYSEIDLRDELSLVEEYYLNGGFFNNNRFEEKFSPTNYAIVDLNYTNLRNRIY